MSPRVSINRYGAAVFLYLVPTGFLLLLLIAPALRLLFEGYFSPIDSYQGEVALWADQYLRWRMVWSFLQAAATCGLAFIIGLPIAWVLARFEFFGRSTLVRLLMLPFVVPTLVAALGVMTLWGPQGVWVWAGGSDWQNTPWLLLYGNLFFNLCVFIRAGLEAFEQINPSQLAVGRSLGATPWRIFLRIEFPQVLPKLMSALCLVFLYCFSGFGMALILGGTNYATAEVEIYKLIAHELQIKQAAVLAIWILLITGIVTTSYVLLEKQWATSNKIEKLPRRPPRNTTEWSMVVASLACLLIICGAPLLALAGRIFFSGGISATFILHVLLDDETLLAIWNTVQFTTLSLGLATVLGLAHAFAAQQSLLFRVLTFLPFMVSPIVVSFGLLLLYPSWSGEFVLIVAAYALLAYPFITKALTSALDSLPANYIFAARTLGASPWRCFCRVTLPLLLPALRRGMAFAAATAVGEFAVSLFMSRPEWITLSTLIYRYLSRPGAANLDAALLLSLVLLTLAIIVFSAIEGAWRSKNNA